MGIRTKFKLFFQFYKVRKMDNLIKQLQMPKELAFRFFAVFSIFEFALKAGGFIFGNERRVDAAWDKFANEIQETLVSIKNTELDEAKKYLFESPPRKQVLKDGRLVFINQTIDTNQKSTQQLLLMVRTVRNNRLPGGKYLPLGEREKGRNELLVKHSITVLLACSKIKKDVFSNFQ